MKILKYEIKNVRDQWQELELPTVCKILKIEGIGSHIHLWAMVDVDSTTRKMPVYCASTGVELSDDFNVFGWNPTPGTSYVESIIQDNGQRVLHIFMNLS